MDEIGIAGDVPQPYGGRPREKPLHLGITKCAGIYGQKRARNENKGLFDANRGRRVVKQGKDKAACGSRSTQHGMKRAGLIRGMFTREEELTKQSAKSEIQHAIGRKAICEVCRNVREKRGGDKGRDIADDEHNSKND